LDSKRTKEAVAEVVEAARLDPVSSSAATYAAWIYYCAGRDPESREWVTRALSLDPNFPFALYVAGRLFVRQGKLDDAIAEFGKAVDSSGRAPKYLFMLADAYVKAGRRDQARKLLDELKEQSHTRYVAPNYLQSLSDELKS
jgi:pentatricopeptide repeat protein